VNGGRTDPEERIVQNEVSLRRVNEAIEAGRRTRDGPVPFVCECGMLGCNELVELTIDEYERVRTDGTRFIVHPGHRTPVDTPVEAGDGFDVVQKDEPGADLAERTDPRSDGRGR
jgi:hypothetical protein